MQKNLKPLKKDQRNQKNDTQKADLLKNNMNRKDIEDLYADDEPEMLFADGYDKAIAGVIWDGERTRVVYTTEDILGILMERDAMTYDEASEFFDFNVANAYMGVYTPFYLET